MAVALTKPWDAAVEKNMRDFYQILSEKTGGALRQCRRDNLAMAV